MIRLTEAAQLAGGALLHAKAPFGLVCLAARRDAGELMALLDALSPEDAASACGATRASSFSALHAAAQGNRVDCVRLLLERRARATGTEPAAGMTALHYAAMAEGSEALQLLLAKAPVSVRDQRGQSLLHAAARSGAVACLSHLLQQVWEGPADLQAAGAGSRPLGVVAALESPLRGLERRPT